MKSEAAAWRDGVDCSAPCEGHSSKARPPARPQGPSTPPLPLASGLQIPLRAERSSSGRRGELREVDTVLISLGREGSRRRGDCQLCKTRGQVFFMSWMPETSWDPRSGELEHLEALEPWKRRCIRVICVRFLWSKNSIFRKAQKLSAEAAYFAL